MLRIVKGLAGLLGCWVFVIWVSYRSEFLPTVFPGFRLVISVGFAACLAGGLLNLIVTWVNGGKMPAVVKGTELKISEDDELHQIVSDKTRFQFLIDRIPIRKGNRVVGMQSIGDVIFHIGSFCIQLCVAVWILWNFLTL